MKYLKLSFVILMGLLLLTVGFAGGFYFDRWNHTYHVQFDVSCRENVRPGPGSETL